MSSPHYNRNRSEIVVLIGAIYSFVAYLTAFALEVLFIIDLTRQPPTHPLSHHEAINQLTSSRDIQQVLPKHATTQLATSDDQLRLEIAQNSSNLMLISCIAMSILYFVLFVASLVLILALIIRSCLCILTWLCIMTTMFLPELAINVYSSVFGWGLLTRNGKVELIFYALRAIFNVIFVIKAHKLYKEWYYEKNFFRMKCASRIASYDSPYFIGSDSLSTTINPMFADSSYRTNHFGLYSGGSANDLAKTSSTAYLHYNANNRRYYQSGPDSTIHRHDRNNNNTREANNKNPNQFAHYQNSMSRSGSFTSFSRPDNTSSFYPYHGQSAVSLSPSPIQYGARAGRFNFYTNHFRDNIDDLTDELEMNVDYRTLTRPTTGSTLTKSGVNDYCSSTKSLDCRPEPETEYEVDLKPLGNSLALNYDDEHNQVNNDNVNTRRQQNHYNQYQSASKQNDAMHLERVSVRQARPLNSHFSLNTKLFNNSFDKRL